MIRIIWTTACAGLLFLSGCTNSNWKHFESTSLADDGGVVPSELDFGDMYIYVSINGHELGKFVLDTGASLNSITPEAARRFGLVANSTIDVRDGNNNIRTLPMATADQVEFGPVVQSGVQFSLLENNFLSDDGKLGTIGINGLHEFTIDLDFPRKRVSITNERLDPQSPSVRPYRLEATGVLNVPVEIESAGRLKTVWSLLDTGSDGGFRLTTDLSRRLTEIKHAKHIDISVGAHDIPWVISAAPLLGSVYLGGTIIDGLSATVNQHGNNIGLGLFHDFHVKIDGVSKLVSFERPDHARRVVWVEQFGLQPLWHDSDGWRLSYVIPGGYAESLGITYEDRVLLLDGKPPADNLYFSDYWPVPTGADHVTLRIEHEGKTRDVVLTLDRKDREHSHTNASKPESELPIPNRKGES